MTARAATLRAMAGRVERADAPTARLFFDCFYLVWPDANKRDDHDEVAAHITIGAYTDAALAFVPAGWTSGQICQLDDGRWFADLRRGYQTSYDKVVNVWSATLALAILASALRALAEETEDE